MILESIVTTANADGSPNISPMGPKVQPPPSPSSTAALPCQTDITAKTFQHFELRPFESSTTFANLKRHPQGVLHVDDDVQLFAQTAIGKITPPNLPPLAAADAIDGHVILTACRAYEFRVKSIDESGPRMSLICEVVKTHRMRDFFGFNRAKHAIIEAAILATRIDFLPAKEIQQQFQQLQMIVKKTAGPNEVNAFNYLNEFVSSKLRK